MPMADRNAILSSAFFLYPWPAATVREHGRRGSLKTMKNSKFKIKNGAPGGVRRLFGHFSFFIPHLSL